MPQSGESASLLCLLSVDVKFDGRAMSLATDAPTEVDIQGSFVDLGPRLRRAFGGGVQAWPGAELTMKVRWIAPPADEEDEPDGE